VLWGLLFAAFLLLEKSVPAIGTLPSWLRRVYVLTIVCFSFVLFNAADLTQAGQDVAAMIGLGGLPLISTEAVYFLRSYAVLFLAGIVGATPVVRDLAAGFERRCPSACAIAEPVILAAIWLLCTACLVDGSFNPFLYFRF
jgi:alginate O-acetyltransferase complex protein AlgI